MTVLGSSVYLATSNAYCTMLSAFFIIGLSKETIEPQLLLVV